MIVSPAVFACYSSACAPPPVGSGGSTPGASQPKYQGAGTEPQPISPQQFIAQYGEKGKNSFWMQPDGQLRAVDQHNEYSYSTARDFGWVRGVLWPGTIGSSKELNLESPRRPNDDQIQSARILFAQSKADTLVLGVSLGSRGQQIFRNIRFSEVEAAIRKHWGAEENVVAACYSSACRPPRSGGTGGSIKGGSTTLPEGVIGAFKSPSEIAKFVDSYMNGWLTKDGTILAVHQHHDFMGQTKDGAYAAFKSHVRLVIGSTMTIVQSVGSLTSDQVSSIRIAHLRNKQAESIAREDGNGYENLTSRSPSEITEFLTKDLPYGGYGPLTASSLIAACYDASCRPPNSGGTGGSLPNGVRGTFAGPEGSPHDIRDFVNKFENGWIAADGTVLGVRDHKDFMGTDGSTGTYNALDTHVRIAGYHGDEFDEGAPGSTLIERKGPLTEAQIESIRMIHMQRPDKPQELAEETHVRGSLTFRQINSRSPSEITAFLTKSLTAAGPPKGRYGRSTSLKWPWLYDILRSKGYDKSAAAAISNSRIHLRKGGRRNVLKAKYAHDPAVLKRLAKAEKAGRHVTGRQLTK